jgi:hypothetical protein
MSVANWHDEYKMAEVTTIKGKHFRTMGTNYKGKLLLEVEEAVFLVDLGALQLYEYGSQPLTFQQALSLLSRMKIPFEHYFVYSYLKKFGYIVRRPPELSTIPPLISSPLQNFKTLTCKINFDVFKPNRSFRKTDSCHEPDFRLCICRFTDPPPSLTEIQSLIDVYGNSKVKFCIVQDSSLSFYSFERLERVSEDSSTCPRNIIDTIK